MKNFLLLVLIMTSVVGVSNAQRLRVDSIWTSVSSDSNLYLVQRLVDRSGNYQEQGTNLGPVASVDTASIISNLKSQNINAFKKEVNVRREMTSANGTQTCRLNENIATAFGYDIREDINQTIGPSLKTVPNIIFLRDSVPVNGWRLIRYNGDPSVSISMDLTQLANGAYRFVNVADGWDNRVLYTVIIRDEECMQINFGDGFRIFHLNDVDANGNQTWICVETNDVLRRIF